jgi:hypothetical protein
MSNKNQIPIKWILIILFSLMAISYCTHRASKYFAMHASSHTSSANFLEFISYMLGMDNAMDSAQNAAKDKQTGNNQNGKSSGAFNTANGQDLNLASSESGTGTSGQISSQEKNNGGNAQGNNPNNNLKQSTDDASDNNADKNSNLNSENNPENNQENNPNYNSETGANGNTDSNTEVNSEAGSGNNPNNNSVSNPDANAENPENNSDNNSENNPGGNSGSTPGNNPGSNPNSGGGDGTTPGGNPASNQPTYPTINPIPSDNAVSQNIAKQNQQGDAVASLLASREALVAPVQEQAQATKYQTTTSSTIPTPNTDEPPPDVKAKALAHQLTLH